MCHTTLKGPEPNSTYLRGKLLMIKHNLTFISVIPMKMGPNGRIAVAMRKQPEEIATWM